MQTLLTVENLKVEFDGDVVLDNVSFELGDNETLAVIGPNGAGKTTLFRALLGIIPYQGRVKWQKGVKIGYVPQKLAIDADLPLTTREFFLLKGESVNQEEIDRVLSVVGFKENQPHQNHLKDHVLNNKIGGLSGGELQRILIAWALLDNPTVLLFDEPTSGIDVSNEQTIYSLLRELQQKEKLTILLISHELQLVYKYATKVICLNKEEVCYGSPKEIMENKNLVKLFGSEVAYYEHH